KDNAKVIVHLNMNEKTIAFSVNGTRYPPVASWTNLPSKLYFVASTVTPGKFKILRSNNSVYDSVLAFVLIFVMIILLGFNFK
ncbi:4861_t:CDS:1, partial [Acaulospora morrowiae]